MNFMTDFLIKFTQVYEHFNKQERLLSKQILWNMDFTGARGGVLSVK
jgi:hypothetical protein